MRQILLSFLFCILLLVSWVSTKEIGVRHYDGYQVLRTGFINTTSQYSFLKSLLLNNIDYDFWSSPKLGGYADIMYPIQLFPQLISSLEKERLSWSVKIADVEKLVEIERTQNDKFRTHRADGENMNWLAYQRWAVIESWILDLPKQFPSHATVKIIGQTFENRSIYMVKVSNGKTTSSTGTPKKSMFFDANIHAREWISSAVLTWIMNDFLNKASSDKYNCILDSMDLYFVPLLNIDGYEYCHTVDRFWRKTRSINKNSPSCRGCDPNRNFGYQFGGEGTSSDPCSSIYHGPFAFSEPETAALRDALHEVQQNSNLLAYITLHSYSQLWLLQWGYTQGVYPRDYDELLSWGKAAVAEIKSVHGTQYTTGQGADLLYGVGGASDDFAKSQGIKYTTTIELRDTGSSGFLLPPNQIIPTAEETLAGILKTAAIIMNDDCNVKSS